MLFKANEGLITKIQAHARGHMARKAYKERVDFMKRQLPAIVKIQVLGICMTCDLIQQQVVLFIFWGV